MTGHVGVLGGGQLGRMLALAGYPLGLRFTFLDAAAESPAAQLASRVIAEPYDLAALARFADGTDVITYEFENVPVEAAAWLAQRKPVYPPPEALAVAQERLAEKTFFQRLGVGVPQFAAIDGRDDFDRALGRVGLPSVLKTRRFGYDGKGQAVLRSSADAEAAWARLGGRPLLLEKFVPFAREVSLIAVRGRGGDVAFWPVTENVHRNGILRTSRPLLGPDAACVQAQAEACGRAALEELDYVGILAIEFFEVSGRLVVNEMAPRVHNSGHWTIDGSRTSQFENHLRAVLGWPLGSTEMSGQCLMINLIGQAPPAADMLAVPGAKVHLYGKTPRRDRKVGHVTICANDEAELAARLTAWRGRFGEV